MPFCKSVDCVAETARFELAVAITRHDGLANRWFQPLTHVSTRIGEPIP
jgi:hypothetical protein